MRNISHEKILRVSIGSLKYSEKMRRNKLSSCPDYAVAFCAFFRALQGIRTFSGILFKFGGYFFSRMLGE
jgi:hypothetical protein